MEQTKRRTLSGLPLFSLIGVTATAAAAAVAGNTSLTTGSY